MTLTAGTRFGPYEVQSPIGAGGMGEVYRAKDTRLDRTVAVKILPSHLSDNPEAKQRFDREARAISSLNHPNICTLHDVGHQDGIDFLVMEFLEGETLADRLRKGPLPTEQVLKIGIEICEGLERAHKSGVVHRDLKPGNVMLTKTGAKLMDFGLAKATPSSASLASSLTMTMPSADQPLTAQGTIVGTFQYMSPEQAEGKEADARSDIFALGSMLYEMTTGKRAFTGKSQASIVAAILASEPPPISLAQPMSPPALEQVVKTCLAKDPEDRFQTVHDLKLQLRWIAEASSSRLALPAQVRARRAVQKRTLMIAAGVGWVVAVAAVIIFLLSRGQLEDARRPMMASWLPPADTQFTSVVVGAPALSPDGSKLAFLTGDPAEPKLWVRDVSTGAVQPIEVERPTFPFWSPDGKYLGFFSAGKLKKVALSGGPVQVLCDAPEGRGGSWSPRGVIIFTPNIREPLYKVPEGGGVAEKLTDSQPGWTQRNPYFLPDGNHFLFTYRDVAGALTSTAGTGALYGASLSGEKPRQILASASNVQYSDGYLLYLRETVLVAQRFDPKSLKFSGDPTPVAEKLDYWNARDVVAFTAAHGTLVYRHGSLQKTQPMWVDRTGKEVGRFGDPGLYLQPRSSPDGSLVGFVRPDADTGRGDVWIIDPSRNSTSRSTFVDASTMSFAFSPDSKRITVSTISGKDSAGFWIQPINGSSTQEKLDTPINFGTVTSWSPNGRYLFFMVQNSATRQDVYYIDLNGDKKLKPFIQSPANDSGAVLSPNGKWLAYISDESGKYEVYVTAFPDPGGKWQVSSGGGSSPSWSAEGKQLYYVAGDKLMMVTISNTDTFQFGAPTALPIHVNEFAALGPVAPGERFPALKALSGGQSLPQEVILNWTGTLKQ